MFTTKTSLLIACSLALSCLAHASHSLPTTLSHCLIASDTCLAKSMKCAITSLTGAAFLGYVAGRSLAKNTPSSMAGTFGAVTVASLSACTVTPYIIYKKSGITGLAWYAFITCFLIAYREIPEIHKSMSFRR